MHPRNVYNNRLDFKKLAEEFPEFRENTSLDLTGRVRLDFKNPTALRALSKTLLKKDFDLDVHLPPNILVPTIPLRLNYILFIEDLLKLACTNENVKGLDIGTGASCVYPLIAARKNGWKMVGTDINIDSIECAKQNVVTNKLEHLIKVVQVSEATVLDEILSKDSTKYDFCMCNPPFFGDLHELCSQLKRKPNRPSPKNAFTAESHEVITEGGEVEFVSKLIDESSRFTDRIRIYTSMLGIKKSVKPLKAKLRGISSVKSTTTTEFFQGHTTRFGIAWTFDSTLNLQQVPSFGIKMKKLKSKKSKPYVHNIKPFNGSIQEVDLKLKEIFNDLQIKYTVSKKNKESALLYNIVAYTDTWSHSRRKQRELAHAIQLNLSSKETSSACDQNIETGEAECPNLSFNVAAKRTQDMKKEMYTAVNETDTLKRKGADSDDVNSKRLKSDEEKHKFLECTVFVQTRNLELIMELIFVEGTGGKAAAHQVFQYIKNHLKFI